MRKLLFVMGLFLSLLPGQSQTALEKKHHLPRVHDFLFKQQVELRKPGSSGANLFWDFSNLKVIEDKYKISYMEYPDSLLIARELRTLYKYALKEDTLVSTGVENATTLLEYVLPELQLVYPVAYKDQGEAYFYGKGDYCQQIDLIHSGKAEYRADAYGELLLPEGDTLKNVLRVKHTRKQLEDQYLHSSFLILPDSCSTDSIEYRLKNDTLWTQTDTYRWYAEGYRYPVFESVEYYVHHQGKAELQAATSFYYPPLEQYYGLEDDPQNREIREILAMNEEKFKEEEKKKSRKRDKVKESLLAEGQATFSYFLYQDRQSGLLTMTYEVEEVTEVSMALIDMQGRVLIQIPTSFKEEGNYRQEFLLNDYPHGEYLLRIVTPEKNYTEKIMH